jgi:molecular chaperone Hsp33
MNRPDNSSRRFLFEEADVRGESVQLGATLVEMLDQQPYSQSVRRLLGEFASAVVLISNNLKYAGRIILQAKSDRGLSLAMVECSSDRHIRGIARGDIDRETDRPMDHLLGGQLAITIERESDQRYQGIISLEGHSLARALESYFAQSEQLGARFWLASDGDQSAGLMLQQLPIQVESTTERDAQWSTLCLLADTMTSQELLNSPPEELLFKLFHEEKVTVYPPAPILFKCRCSRERSASTIAMLPEKEQAEILAEQGKIVVTCELCGATYQFNQVVLNTDNTGHTLH